MSNLTAEEKITKAVISLQKSKPFWSYLILHLKRKPMTKEMKESCIAREMNPTCAVDISGNLYYAEEWIDTLPQDQIEAVICHEVFHSAFTHLARIGQKDQLAWNFACDIVTNDTLITDGFNFPKGCLIPSGHEIEIGGKKIIDIDKKSAEQIYNELPFQNQKQKGDSGKGNKDKGTDSDGQGFDEHIYEGENGKGRKPTQAELDRVKKDWEKRLVEAVTFAKQRGILPAGMERKLEELLNSKVSWKEKLYKYITNQIPHDYTWARCSRRTRSTGIYLPSTLKENLLITVAVDVSGSIGQKEYQEFISEMVGISKSFQNVVMNCLFWDTEVNSDLMMKNGNIKIIEDTKINGCGGTTFGCVAEYLKEQRKRPNIMVVFTDGFVESTYEKIDCPHLFVISEGGDGKVFEKNGENVIKLNKTGSEQQ